MSGRHEILMEGIISVCPIPWADGLLDLLGDALGRGSYITCANSVTFQFGGGSKCTVSYTAYTVVDADKAKAYLMRKGAE